MEKMVDLRFNLWSAKEAPDNKMDFIDENQHSIQITNRKILINYIFNFKKMLITNESYFKNMNKSFFFPVKKCKLMSYNMCLQYYCFFLFVQFINVQNINS